jgi:hypothetical protein
MTGRSGTKGRQTANAVSTRKHPDFRVPSRCAGGAASPGTPAARAGLRRYSSASGA